MDLVEKIRNIPDFPKKGVVFRDITTLLKDPEAFRNSIKKMRETYSGKSIDKIVGMESRGFIFGSVLAHELGVGFIPARKPGKLPAETVQEDYKLEYGTDALEIHRDAIQKNDNILIVDDLLATGGTASATARLVEKMGGKISGMCFLIELAFLKGRDRLKGYDINSLISYESE